MKIHVVQQGETLWTISQKYGVDFEELKAMNSHLSNPDMIMPGMKIKVPSTSKQVKQDKPKEQPKPQTQQQPDKKMFPEKDKKQQSLDKVMKKYPVKKEAKPPVKDTLKDVSEKAMPIMKEDDDKKPKKGSESMPMEPMNIPPMPEYNQTAPEAHHPYMHQQMPSYPTQTPMPVMPAYHQPASHYCTPMNAVPYHVPQMPMHPAPYAPYSANQGYGEVEYEETEWMESSSLEMPEMPGNIPGVPTPNQPGGYGPTSMPYSPYQAGGGSEQEQPEMPGYPGYTPNYPAGQQSQPQPYGADYGQGYPGYGQQGYPMPQMNQQTPYMPQMQQPYGAGMVPPQAGGPVMPYGAGMAPQQPMQYGPGMMQQQPGYPTGYPSFQQPVPGAGMGYPYNRYVDEDDNE